MQSPWSVEAEAVEDGVQLGVMLSTDPGPMREFRPFLTLDLDEAHAIMLLGQLHAAVQELREARGEADLRAIVVPIRGAEPNNG